MRTIEVLNALHEDHQEVRDLADRVDIQLRKSSTRGPVELLAAQVLDFNANVLVPHLDIEDQALLHVAREHLADQHADRLQEADVNIDAISGAIEDLRHRVQSGDDLRAALTDVASAMRGYVEYEEASLIPWLEKELGEILLREVAIRFELIHNAPDEEPVDVQIDLEALSIPIPY